MTAGNITTDRPLARSPSSPTHSHHHSFSVPTPALLESLAGGAHYSGVKIDHDASKARRNSHGKPSNHLEVKADHKKVIEDLQELYSCRPTVEIFERRWRPDAIFEDPLVRCKGFDEYAAQWFAMPKLFTKSETTSTRVLSSTGSPNRLVYAQTQEYTMRLFGKKSISSIIVVDLDDAEKIIGLIDQWDGKPLPVRYGANFLRTANAKVCRWLIKVPRR